MDKKVKKIIKEGKLSNITTQRKNPKRVNISIDDEFAFGLYRELLADHGIYKGQILTIEQQQSLIDADNLIRAKFVILDYLSYQQRTESEVREKLRSKDFSDNVIEQVIERFKELNYINDVDYAQLFATTRLKSKGYGPRRIQNDLRKKGIDRKIISETIEELKEKEDPFEAAKLQGEKRWQRLQKEPDKRKRIKKLNDFLLRRGFDFDTINAVIRELQQNDVDNEIY